MTLEITKEDRLSTIIIQFVKFVLDLGNFLLELVISGVFDMVHIFTKMFVEDYSISCFFMSFFKLYNWRLSFYLADRFVNALVVITATDHKCK